MRIGRPRRPRRSRRPEITPWRRIRSLPLGEPSPVASTIVDPAPGSRRGTLPDRTGLEVRPRRRRRARPRPPAPSSRRARRCGSRWRRRAVRSRRAVRGRSRWLGIRTATVPRVSPRSQSSVGGRGSTTVSPRARTVRPVLAPRRAPPRRAHPGSGCRGSARAAARCGRGPSHPAAAARRPARTRRRRPRRPCRWG